MWTDIAGLRDLQSHIPIRLGFVDPLALRQGRPQCGAQVATLPSIPASPGGRATHCRVQRQAGESVMTPVHIFPIKHSDSSFVRRESLVILKAQMWRVTLIANMPTNMLPVWLKRHSR